MAGGTFVIQNKIRPGAYINFKGVVKPVSSLGIRGVMTMPVPMSWGATVTELLSTDLIDGKSLKKIGYSSADEESQIFREALKNAYKAIIYRLDTGGSKASATILSGETNTLSATALYAGTAGNEVSVAVIANGLKFDVVTTFRNVEQDRQTAATVAELADNDWVVFSGSGNLSASAGSALSGGTNGTVSEGTYATYLDTIKSYYWSVMGIPQDVPAVVSSIETFIKNQREVFGKKVQAVLYNVDSDHEGIISVNQGYATVDEEVSPTTFVAYIAGVSAGAAVNESNTYHVIKGATSIVYPAGVTPYGEEEIITALQGGKLVISSRQDGAIVIEKDINTLHTFDSNKSEIFSKNRVVRTLDDISNSVSRIFEISYIGKVNNDEAGRNIFKADLINYLNNLQSIAAIQNFDSGSDIEILAGESIDALIVNLAIQPADSMEKLYMTVTVG